MRELKDIRHTVKKAYGEIAREAAASGRPSPRRAKPSACCGKASSDAAPTADLGLSCGNPVAFSEIRPGETVLDLGSGAGRDVFPAARLVGERGRVIGVDMTPDMLRLATRNAATFKKKCGLDNVEFRRGQIERLPVESGSVDLVISNCVINLSPDKAAVFREVHRVLRPGGRMVVSDIVLDGELPEELKSDEMYVSCVSGALPRKEYLKAIRQAGFRSVKILADSSYRLAAGCCESERARKAARRVQALAASITVRAVKSRAGTMRKP